MIEFCRSQQRFDGRRIGMRSLELRCTYNPRRDLRTCVARRDRDGTEYTKRIAAQIEENGPQFEYIANFMSVIVWTTTPESLYDRFSQLKAGANVELLAD